jgi:flagellar hook-basal body complex protein FliE
MQSITQLGVGAASSQPLVTPHNPTPSDARFKDLLFDSIQQVNSMQQEANRAVESLMTGGPVSPAQVLTAVQKADLAFKLLMQIRNKLVQAYQEVQNVRV